MWLVGLCTLTRPAKLINDPSNIFRSFSFESPQTIVFFQKIVIERASAASTTSTPRPRRPRRVWVNWDRKICHFCSFLMFFFFRPVFTLDTWCFKVFYLVPNGFLPPSLEAWSDPHKGHSSDVRFWFDTFARERGSLFRGYGGCATFGLLSLVAYVARDGPNALAEASLTSTIKAIS